MGDAPEPKRPRTGDAEETFVGSIDQGTTSTRFVIFNANGEPVALHQMGFGNVHPESGYAFLPRAPGGRSLRLTSVTDGTNTTPMNYSKPWKLA